MAFWHQMGILIIVAFVGLGQCDTTKRSSYGETCDRGVRCDSRASLACVEGVCRCIKPDEMTYEAKSQKCVVLSGERCSYTAIEITDTAQEKRWTERLACTENAICNTDGYCGCESTYFESAQGLCVPKYLHGENCTKSEECRSDLNLICSANYQCVCNSTESIFDVSYNNCVARVGYSCDKYPRCVRNAYCPKQQSYISHGSRYSGSADAFTTCKCSSDYTLSKTGLCLAKHSMSCNAESAPCNELYSCISGRCMCPFPDHQSYNNSKCVSYVSGPCSEEASLGLTFECVPNAECRNDNGVFECLCKPGYIESNGRQCDVAYGQPCNEGTTCDEVAMLHCKQGKCSCGDFQIYDTKMTQCRGLVGAKCELTKANFCVNGASCQMSRGSPGQGVCRCTAPSVPDANRQCQTSGEGVSARVVEMGDDSVETGSAASLEISDLAESTTTT